MWRIEGDVEKPRLLFRASFTQKFHRVIDVGGGGVKSLIRHSPRLAVQTKRMIATIIIRRTREMAEVALEAEVCRLLIKMPFSCHRREITCRCEHFRNRHSTTHALISRLPTVAAREQRNARGMALRRVVELRHAQAIRRETIQHGCLDLTAITPEIGKSKIIDHDQKEIRLRCRMGGEESEQEEDEWFHCGIGSLRLMVVLPSHTAVSDFLS